MEKPNFIKLKRLSESVALVIVKEGEMYRFAYCEKEGNQYEYYSSILTPDIEIAERYFLKEYRHQFS